MRFSPEANWNIHLGHFKIIKKNLKISKILNKKINLRIDDTNSKKNKKKYIYSIIKNINYIFKKNKIIKFNKKIFYSSKYFFKYYQYIEKLYKYKKKFFLKKIRKIKNGKYKEKKKVIKIFKKKIIYRIIYKKHYKTKYSWFIYPTYDYSHNISDKIENIKYSICGEEFLKNKPIYNIITNILYKKKKTKQFETKKIKIKNFILSKSKLRKLLKKKYIKNSKDLRLKTLNNFKKITNKNNIFYKNIKLINWPKKKIKIFKNKILNQRIIINKKNIFKKNKLNILKGTKYMIKYYFKKNIVYCKIYKIKKLIKKIKWLNNYNNKIKKKIFKNLLIKKYKKINIKNEKIKISLSKIKNIKTDPPYTIWTYKPKA